MNRREAIRILSASGIGIGLTPGAIEDILLLRSKITPAVDVPEEVTLIADIILPRTDTPGALDAGAPEFAMHMLAEIRSADERSRFTAGLSAFRDNCRNLYGLAFSELTAAQRESHLRSLIDSEDEFFKQVHGLVLISYFTSEEGMTQALVYNPIPMQYQPCVKVDNNTRGEASYF